MKKINSIKILSFIICLVVLLGLLTMTVSAQKEYYTPIEWELDQNLEYIYGDDKLYERYYVRGAFYGDADSVFYFKNYALYNGSECQVYGDSAYPHIVSVKTEPGYSCIFVDAEGKKILDSFLDKTDCIYYLEDYGVSYTIINKTTVEYLDTSYESSTKLKWVDVSELGEAGIYEITVHDKTETKAYQHGAVYIMPNGSYYYVCFENLGNSYFDANGYFSYRAGSIMVYELDDMARMNIDQSLADMTPKRHHIIYESAVVNGYYDVYGNPIIEAPTSDQEASGFVTIIVVGTIFPVILLILGIVLAKSEKTKKSKCWYSLSASAALWILSTILFLLLVIL